jgi:hypothetical protein
MKFYIPEIGDQIRLVSDWSFQLYSEYRNRKLWDMAKADKHPDIAQWEKERDFQHSELERLKSYQVIKHVQERNWRHGYGYMRDSANPEFVTVERKVWKNPDHEKEYEEIRSNLWKNNTPRVPFSLPAGSLMSVDRIYIRKGVSEYSSITFYLKESTWKPFAAKKKGAMRFWAKLADVNTIEFEHVAR